MIEQPEKYEQLTDDEKKQLNIFDLLVTNQQTAILLENILNFFMTGDVSYSTDNNCFIVKENNKNAGIISKNNYHNICDVICQRNCINSQTEDDAKAKNQKVSEIMEKLKKGRTQKARQTKADKKMELGNIISAVANKSNTLNILNIW